MSTIDTLLYRPLKSGTAYNGLIPAYKGTDHKFDKNSDNSTTYDTLRFMAQWSEKYASQMRRIAPLLRGKTIEETANKIYQFLYHHFQYKLDGEMQNLYSPSAAWHFRKTGFDCKTYSILASTILQNLGIDHAFRMVQQAGIMPGEWSHVYVVVPNGEKYAIIDATTHTNKEVSFTKKHDYTMKHRGLASPYINGLGCACQGKPINSTGLGSPSVLTDTINNFHLFLNELETNGVPREVTNRMLDLVKWNVQNGIDPIMGEIISKASVQGLGAIQPLSSLQSQGLTYSTTPISGGISTMVNIGSGPGGWTSELTKGFSIDGKPLPEIISNVKSGVTGVVTGDTGAIVKSISTFLPLEKTFGAVFANGFDLSCWGSSYSEQKAKEDITLDMPFIMQWSGVFNNPSTATLDKFLLLSQQYLEDSVNGQSSKYASCTRKGHSLRQKAIETLIKNVFETFTSNNYVLTPNGTKTTRVSIEGGLPGYAKGHTFSTFNQKDTTYTTYILSQAPVAPTPTTTQTVVTNADGTQTVVNTPTAKKSSSLLLPIIGVGVLAAKFLI